VSDLKNITWYQIWCDTLIDIHSDDYLNKGCGVTLWPCHFTIKKYLKAKEEEEEEELWKLKYNFTMQKHI
jgi:hypothetical protein